MVVRFNYTSNEVIRNQIKCFRARFEWKMSKEKWI